MRDLAADNVVYAEVRFAPELHMDGGLSLDDVVDAVLAGFADGEKSAAADGHRITVRCLVTAMRHAPVPVRSPNWRSGSATRASSVSTSPGPRPVIHRPGISTRSNTCGKQQRPLHHSRR